MRTREQLRAQRAYERVARQVAAVGDDAGRKSEADYQRFAKRFPALIHGCGFAQAVAFAQAKGPSTYLADLAHVVDENGGQESLAQQAREAHLPDYQRLSRDALAAASWLKRYAEAVLRGEDE